MENLTLTKKQARRFLLVHQSLWPPYGLEGEAGILDFIRRVGCIQFDPLDIVGHNPELVLQSRVADFRPVMLEELLYKDRKLLDGWDKQMAIYCTDDWPYFIYRQREAAERSRNWLYFVHRQGGAAERSRRRSTDPVKDISPQILEAIEERGPLSSIDLEHDQKVAWSWGPKRLANAALDNMFYLGELVIHHKVHTRKVYDLARRHIPEEILNAPDPHQTREEYHDWHILRRIGGAGLLWNKGRVWPWIYGARGKERVAALARLTEQGKAVEVRVEGIMTPLYMRSQDRTELDSVIKSDEPPSRAAILAPLDNLLWERDLVKQIFDFDYTWEVYKPVAERKYGYYVLPVLYGDKFVARFEPGQEKNGNLVIKNWWWESGMEKSAEIYNGLRDCFERFLGYLGTDKIQVEKSLVKREGLEWLP